MRGKRSRKSKALSRRGLLQNVATYAAGALTVGVAGCQSKTQMPAGDKPLMMANVDASHKPPPEDQPQISADEGTFALQQLTDRLQVKDVQNELGFRPDGIHGIHFRTDGDEDSPLFYEIAWSGNNKPHSHEEIQYEHHGQHRKARVIVQDEPSRVPLADIRVGYGVCAPCSGTLGWTIYFNSAFVGISALHALSTNLVNPVLNSVVKFDDGTSIRTAKLKWWRTIVFGGAPNTFDVGVAQYDVQGDADRIVRTCANSSHYPYPPSLYSLPTTSVRYHKVGCGPTICDSGVLNGYANKAVQIPNGPVGNDVAVFNDLLMFDRFAFSGDSGASLCRDSDTYIAGLHLTHDSSSSYSTAFYKIDSRYGGPWTYAGEKTLGSRTVPKYTAGAPTGPA